MIGKNWAGFSTLEQYRRIPSINDVDEDRCRVNTMLFSIACTECFASHEEVTRAVITLFFSCIKLPCYFRPW